ncbi:MAG: zinc ribbon domain-containing protein [Clostridia bacterium]|nr:zinc ribbon domain-containing protein [Clostridia bacterium]
MICKNCGSELETGEVFCGKCGSKTEAEEPITAETQESENVDSTTYYIDPETDGNNMKSQIGEEPVPTGKKKKKWIKWTSIILIVGILVSAIVWAFPYISNTFWSIVLSDEDYFKHVVENNASDYIENIADVYAEMMELYENDETLQYDVKINLGAKTKELVYDYSYGNVNLNWLDNVSINGQSGYKDGKMYESDSISVNGQAFTNMNLVMDDNGVYVDLPGLSSKGVYAKYGNGSDVAFRAVSAFHEVAPDEDVFEELFVRYVNCLTENVEEVEKTSDTIEAGGVSQSYTKLSATIDQDVVEKAIIAVLTEAKDDEEIKELITDFCNSSAILADADEVYDDFRDGIDDLLDEVEINDKFKFYFNIWVDAKGDIIGMGIDIDGTEIYYANVVDVNLFSPSAMGTMFKIDSSDFKLAFEGDGTLESGKFNGDYSLKINGSDIADVKLVGLDYSLVEDGILNGKVEVSLAEDAKKSLKLLGNKAVSLIADSKIVLDFKTTEKNKNIVDVIISSGNDELLSMNINTNVVNQKVPEINNYIYSDDYRELNNWLETVGENAITKLMNLGLDRTTALSLT